MFIADDEAPARERLRALLADIAGELPTRIVGEARNGIEVMEAFPASGAQVLLLDVAMPGMSGPDLYDELRRREQQIPVIFITAHGSDALRKRLLTEGAAGFLLKPFDPNALITTLERALENAD